jgi:hypothetical protein
MTLRSPAQPELWRLSTGRCPAPFFPTWSRYGAIRPTANPEWGGPGALAPDFGAPGESRQPLTRRFGGPAVGTRLAFSQQTQKEE